MSASPMAISLTGLGVEWRRLEVISENLANLNTSLTALGESYRPLRLLSGPRSGFEAMSSSDEPRGVMVYGVEELDSSPRRVRQPDHPHADAEGYVSYPGLDYSAEMVLLLQTQRAYEANVVALQAARQMYSKALEIGRR